MYCSTRFVDIHGDCRYNIDIKQTEKSMSTRKTRPVRLIHSQMDVVRVDGRSQECKCCGTHLPQGSRARRFSESATKYVLTCEGCADKVNEAAAAHSRKLRRAYDTGFDHRGKSIPIEEMRRLGEIFDGR